MLLFKEKQNTFEYETQSFSLPDFILVSDYIL